MLQKIGLPFLCLLNFASLGMEKKNITFDDTMTLDGTKLVLNAMGIRRVSRFGIPIKVYVGGFYVAKKATDREEMLKQKAPIFFRSVYLLSVGRKDLVEGWNEAFKDNCEKDCEKAKEGLKQFTDIITDVSQGTPVTVKIDKDSLEVSSAGREPKKGIVKNAAFAGNFMTIFFGNNPSDPAFQKELLGAP